MATHILPTPSFSLPIHPLPKFHPVKICCIMFRTQSNGKNDTYFNPQFFFNANYYLQILSILEQKKTKQIFPQTEKVLAYNVLWNIANTDTIVSINILMYYSPLTCVCRSFIVSLKKHITEHWKKGTELIRVSSKQVIYIYKRFHHQ